MEKLTGKFVPRIGDRKNSVVFDAKKEPLPPVIEKTIKLKNRFSDRRLKDYNRKKPGKTVHFSGKVMEWSEITETQKEPKNIIDKILEEGIL